jgi:hypothetical protein
MLDIVSSASQMLTTGSDIVFDTNRVATSCTARHIAGTSVVTLNRPGYYFVGFNTIATATEATETNPITVQLFNNGDEILGATASGLSVTNTTDINLSFQTIIKIMPSCCAMNNTGNLTFRTTGADATFTTPNVVVFYID